MHGIKWSRKSIWQQTYLEYDQMIIGCKNKLKCYFNKEIFNQIPVLREYKLHNHISELSNLKFWYDMSWKQVMTSKISNLGTGIDVVGFSDLRCCIKPSCVKYSSEKSSNKVEFGI